MKKSILLSFLALLLPSMALAATYSGTPTSMADMATKKDAKGCYQISSAEDLYGFAAIVNGGEASACGKLMEDIYVNGDANTTLASMLNEDGTAKTGMDVKSWTPIGTEDKPFSGSFDGNDHAISGLYYNDASGNYVGLFGFVTGGTADNPVFIKDVSIVDSYIKGYYSVGGLVGYAYGATVCIMNSYSAGKVNGSYNVGGLVGYVNSSATVSITNSYSGGGVSGSSYVGGLLGSADGTVSITNSYNNGSVTGKISVGGLVGYAYDGSTVSITHSYNVGGVTGSGDNVGGLVGCAGGATITNSYNVGGVTGSGDNVGGLVGYAYDGSTVSITNSYNNGSVTGKGSVGGLVGCAGGATITNSYNVGGVTGSGDNVGGLVGYVKGTASITNSYNNGSVTGKISVGGLVGYVKETASITNSYNVGRVTGSGNYVGGLVGNAYLSATVSITNSYSAGDVTGSRFVGGLVGYAGGATITNSYNIGAVSAEFNFVGGLVGYVNGTASITNSFAMLVSKDGLEQPLADDKTLAEHIVGSDESYDEDAEKKKRFRDADDFHDGSIANLLHDWCEKEDGSKTCKSDGKNGLVWGQHVGHDVYPVLSSTFDDAGNLLPGVVEFDLDCVLNGGVNAEGAVATYVYGKEIVLPVPARAGYAFEGWFESEDFSGSKVTTIAKDATGAKKFYAKWSEPIEYTVTYNNVNGAINTNPTAYTVDTEKVNLSALARDGYKFLGWFDGKGDDANEVKKIAGGETGNVILYAHWSIETYEIKVAVNDSKMGTVSGAGSYEYGAEITLVATAADGYKFSNWEDDAKASATRKVTVTGEASYKANFEKVAASSSSKKASSSSSVIPGSSSSSVKPRSSSSVIPGSSSSVIPGSDPESRNSSSSAKRNSSSSAKKDAIVASAKVPMFSVTVMGRNLQIAGAPVGEKIAILDMQGRVLNAGLASTGRVDAANFNVAMPRSGSYMVRIGNQVQRVNVK